MSLLYIKESYVYDLPGREMHCNTDGCGYWRGNNKDHSMLGQRVLRMFKVNGSYCTTKSHAVSVLASLSRSWW